MAQIFWHICGQTADSGMSGHKRQCEGFPRSCNKYNGWCWCWWGPNIADSQVKSKNIFIKNKAKIGRMWQKPGLKWANVFSYEDLTKSKKSSFCLLWGLISESAETITNELQVWVTEQTRTRELKRNWLWKNKKIKTARLQKRHRWLRNRKHGQKWAIQKHIHSLSENKKKTLKAKIKN